MINLETVPEITLDELFSSRVLTSGVAPDVRLVDVRSPSEFDRDHVPGSVSTPLFDDQERAVVGTLYRHGGQTSAKEWGEQRVVARLGEYTRELVTALGISDAPAASRRVVLCARGGLRSRAVVQLLRSLGHDVVRLRGGYRAYRSHVRSELEALEIPRPVVLHGLTGVGKTQILREVERIRPGTVLDLEGLAGHRSSVLGAVGLNPVSQKRFESLLCENIRNLRGPWTLSEWEARRLGDRQIPTRVHREFSAGVSIMITAEREQRIQQLVDDYVTTPVAAGATLADIVDQLRDAVSGLHSFPRIGAPGVERLHAWLDRERFDAVAGYLLDQHYDARYRHSQETLTVDATFAITTIEDVAERIVHWIETSGAVEESPSGRTVGR